MSNNTIPKTKTICVDYWTEVCYLVVNGGSGTTRMALSEVPQWLLDHPGYMIISLRRI